tara:strand:- start:77 stop:268 length:192 start_codon:yes stop_codon:yes gene_type:complete
MHKKIAKMKSQAAAMKRKIAHNTNIINATQNKIDNYVHASEGYNCDAHRSTSTNPPKVCFYLL